MSPTGIRLEPPRIMTPCNLNEKVRGLGCCGQEIGLSDSTKLVFTILVPIHEGFFKNEVFLHLGSVRPSVRDC